MKKIVEELSSILEEAFKECGYDSIPVKAVVSNRPDLCQYQCNGALAGAKIYKKAPIMIAQDVADKIKDNTMFSKIEAVNPGFINISVSDEYLACYANKMATEDSFGAEFDGDKTVIVDYGGANVAKPLHIGHLRSAVIGESIKRIKKYAGNNVIGDVHLGDWGLQMGLIITELKERKPDLPYFDENFEGEYPSDAPFDISELEDIYPCASGKAKEDEGFAARAHEATVKLQSGYKPYIAIWKHIIDVSVNDLKKNYDNLDVHFDLWKGESDAQEFIPGLLDDLVEKGLAYESNGALVVDIAKPEDKKEYPPCIVRKSDGGALYATSDIGTVIQRERDYKPDEYIYLADKRQDLHYIQFFRVCKMAGYVNEDTPMTFLGFGTMNGKDNKPFKTRTGGVMRLEYLIKEINDAVYNRIIENRDVTEEEARKTAEIVGLAALKYGDLSNQASKDYIFDIERFTSFEGNTGPYILYTIVRIKSIIEKYLSSGKSIEKGNIICKDNPTQTALILKLSGFADMIESAADELAPHKICAYIYELANEFNRFYHETPILSERDEKKLSSYISLLDLVKRVLETCIDLLGFKAPDKM